MHLVDNQQMCNDANDRDELVLLQEKVDCDTDCCESKRPENKKVWRQWHPTPVLLPGKPRGRRSLVGCSPWGCEESDMTERLHFHVSLSCFGEGNGNPLQCSCLENPRDGGAWWAAVYGVTQSRTQLKRLSKDPESLPLHLIDWTFKRHKTKNVTSYSISVLGVLSHVQLLAAPQTIAHQAPL